MRTLILLFCSVSAFAGESLQIGANTLGSVNAIPNTPSNRLEFYISGWEPGITHLISSSGATGWVAYTQTIGETTYLYIYNSWTAGGSGAYINLSGLSNLAAYVRAQHNPAAMQDLFELWDSNGNEYFSTAYSYTSENNPGGTDFSMGGGGPPDVYVGFMRAYDTLLPLNSRVPTTVDNSPRIFEWKFDGSLVDSSGNGHTADTSGPPAYLATPYQNLVVSAIKTANATVLLNTPSQRAGYPAAVDGTASFSQADASASVTCFWQVLSGPSTPYFSSRSSCTPTLTGLVFGDYLVQLTVTDTSGDTAVSTADIGAVATDNNGVVVNANPNVDALFGNMIQFGRNPWGYADYWAQHAMMLRAADYAASGWTGYQWEQLGSGTTSYYWNGVGPEAGNNALGTILTSGITAAATAIPVADTTKLDLSQYPTRILIAAGNYPSYAEEIRICSVTAGTPPAGTLDVCYDGRGQTAQAWPGGAIVGQSKITGAGTHFLTDAVAPVCPVGAPAPPGPASYSTGTVTLTPGSTLATGSGTAWTSAMQGSFMRVYATHGGTPYYFVAQIASVNSVTSIALARAYPADSDNGTFPAYAIVPGNRTIVLRAPHATDPSGLGEWMWSTTGCESEAAIYNNPFMIGNSFAGGHDIPALDGTLQSGYRYSVTDSTGWVNQSSTGGISFYGESLASRATYYRSGLTAALNAARVIDNHLPASPWGNQDGNGVPALFVGGLGIAAFASAVLDNGVSWSELRSYAARGENYIDGFYNGGTPNCEFDDTRDSGYAFAWVNLGAIYDPDTSPGGFRSRWIGDLANMQAVDNACKRADNSWSNGFLWTSNAYSGGFGPLTLTANSTAVTGAGLVPSNCNGTASGSGTIVNGGSTLTATSGLLPAVGSGYISTVVVTGTLGGNPFTGSYAYSGSGSSVTISVLWPGDTGAVTWMSTTVQSSTNNNAMVIFATGNEDYTDLANNYACLWNSATSLTLDHPWAGATGSSYYGYLGNLGGFGQQPFMLGIKTYGMNLLANSGISPYASAYQTFVRQSTQWLHDKGIDGPTLTTNYGRVFGFCEPQTISSSTVFDVRTPGCNYGTSPGGLSTGREQNQELGNSIALFYQNNPSAANKTWGDQVYGAVWGNQNYNTGGVYWDAASDATNIGATNLLDSYINIGKWYGFFAGIGMLHRWPAVRLGGVAPADNRTVYIPFSLSGVPNAAEVQLTITHPTGASEVLTCPASPCAVTVDARSGSVLMKMDYLNSSGTVVAPGDSIPFYVAQ